MIYRALSAYTRPPNVSNLDTHWHIPKDGLWQQWVDERVGNNTDVSLVKPRQGSGEWNEDQQIAKDEERYQLHQRKENHDPNTSQMSAGTIGSSEKLRIHDSDVSPSTSDLSRSGCLPSTLIRRLRWVTLGFQYDWFTKEYVTNSRSPFPTDFATICQTIVAAVGPFLRVRKGAKGNGADMEGDDPEKYYARRRQKLDGMAETSTSAPVASTSPSETPVNFPIVR